MYFSSFACFLPFISLVVGQDTNLTVVKNAFDAANIPSNLNVVFNPSVLLEVSLPQASGNPVSLYAGIQVPRNATAGPPTFTIHGEGSTGPFVIAAVDPDAPTPQSPTVAQIRHFLGGSFVPNSSTFVLSNSTAAISEWLQPAPPAGSDPHRYIFLLFNQSSEFTSETLVNHTTPITSFNVSAFAAATNLGAPIGGTFMVVGPAPQTGAQKKSQAVSSRIRDTGLISILITIVASVFVL